MKKVILIWTLFVLTFTAKAQSTYQLWSVTPFTQLEQLNGEWTMTAPINLQYNVIHSFGDASQYFFGGGIGGGLNLSADGAGKIDLNFPLGAYIGGQPLPSFPAVALGGGVNLQTGNPILMLNLNFSATKLIKSIQPAAPRYRQLLSDTKDYGRTEIGFTVE
jgi:hypothetical protein